MPPESTETEMQIILEGFRALRDEVKGELKELRNDLRSELRRLGDKLSENQVDLARTDSRVTYVQQCTDANAEKLVMVERQVDDHEGRISSLETSTVYQDRDIEEGKQRAIRLAQRVWEIAKVAIPAGAMIYFIADKVF